MPPVKHALLSASSASRWLVCTAAPRFEEGLPESTSEYAEEGRLAHAIGELKVTKKCTPMSTRTYNTRLNKLKKDPPLHPGDGQDHGPLPGTYHGASHGL